MMRLETRGKSVRPCMGGIADQRFGGWAANRLPAHPLRL
jgi:hypothetical protein